jgi:integrase
VWVFLFREDSKHRSVNIGTVEKYPTKASAEKAANKIRKDINGRREFVYVRDLLNKYEKEGLPDREVTQASYLSFAKRIRERWGSVRLDMMAKDLMGVEQWINSLQTYPTKNTPSRDLSKKSKIHVKAFIHRLFERAIFWNLLDLQRNPIGLVSVKGRGGRVKPMVVVTVEQYLKILADPKLPEHAKVMVQIAMCLGLRASETLGLKWIDIDFEQSTIRVRRSVVGATEDDTKTPESAQTIPAHPELMEALRVWKETQDVNGWVFGSPLTGRPYWRGVMQQDHLTPAGGRAGITGLGWHSFRHTYRTMLRESGQPMEVQQKLMRHTDIRTTMGYGEQSMIEERKAANILIFEKVRKTA